MKCADGEREQEGGLQSHDKMRNIPEMVLEKRSKVLLRIGLSAVRDGGEEPENTYGL